MGRAPGKTGHLLAPVVGAVLALAALAAPAGAESVEEFYKGRVVNLVVGQTPGGGYDLTARVVARYLGKHIPGDPTVVVQNMPGAGAIKAANYLYAIAPKNGSVISLFARYLVLEPLFSDQQWDSTQFVWLGSVSRDFSTCVTWYQSPVKTWQDALTTQFTTGGQSAGSEADTLSLALKNLLGAKIKLITGFPGSNEIVLAMERGEIDGMCGASYSSLKSRRADMLAQKRINILLQSALEKSSELPDVPLITDLTRDPEKIQILRLIVGTQGMARPFNAPPGIPEDRAAALRAAFDATMKDPDFVADATKMEIDVSPTSGAAMAALIKELYATPKDLAAKAARAMSAP
jgi:tripartite-type tricarboxylate transporter receptor subunit TctC